VQSSILVGFLVGFGSLVVSILIESHFNFSAVTAFFNFSAMLIIFGGISGAIIVSYPVAHLKEIPVALKKSFAKFSDIEMVAMANELITLAQKSRQEGILALEAVLTDIKDDWMRRSLQLVVDGLDRKVVQDILEVELEEYSKKTRIGSKIFTALGGYSPTLGIIGTVMGLVHMLATLEDASKIGAAIAVAFLATFWGILSANLVFLPIAERTKAKDNQMIACRQAMIEGILSIQAGESVRIIEEKLKVFMIKDEIESFDTIRKSSGSGRSETQ